MAKTQDLPLNPSKVSGVCGRLLCCLSYENDQYKQQKNLLPKLGQPVQTPMGDGMVISLQVLRELVTVRYQDETPDQTFTAADLGLQPKSERTQRPDVQRSAESGEGEPAQRRRRRRGRGRGQAQNPEAQV